MSYDQQWVCDDCRVTLEHEDEPCECAMAGGSAPSVTLLSEQQRITAAIRAERQRIASALRELVPSLGNGAGAYLVGRLVEAFDVKGDAE